MANEYKPRGALFSNKEKVLEKHPDYSGDIEISPALIADLNAQLASGVPLPKIRLAGWDKEGPSAGAYISLSPSPMLKPKNKTFVADNQAKPMPVQPKPTPVEISDGEIPF